MNGKERKSRWSLHREYKSSVSTSSLRTADLEFSLNLRLPSSTPSAPSALTLSPSSSPPSITSRRPADNTGHLGSRSCLAHSGHLSSCTVRASYVTSTVPLVLSIASDIHCPPFVHSQIYLFCALIQLEACVRPRQLLLFSSFPQSHLHTEIPMRSDLASPSGFASTPSVQLSFQNDIQQPAPTMYHAIRHLHAVFRHPCLCLQQSSLSV